MKMHRESGMNHESQPDLGALERRPAPPRLSARLRVMASREALRRRRNGSVAAFTAYLGESAALLFNNLMRPFAVPVAGGLASAMLLFGTLAPQLTVNRNILFDVPILGLATQASLESSFSFNLVEVDVVVDVTIDEQGRVVGYSIPRGQAWAADPDLLRGIENTLLCTKFTPATIFGQPASGKTRITMRRSRLDVQG